jgi:hypothetical protein
MISEVNIKQHSYRKHKLSAKRSEGDVTVISLLHDPFSGFFCNSKPEEQERSRKKYISNERTNEKYNYAVFFITAVIFCSFVYMRLVIK